MPPARPHEVANNTQATGADNEPFKGELPQLLVTAPTELHPLHSTPSWQCQSQVSAGAAAGQTDTHGGIKSSLVDCSSHLALANREEEAHYLKQLVPPVRHHEAANHSQATEAHNEPSKAMPPQLAMSAAPELCLLYSTPPWACQSQISAGAVAGHTDATRGGLSWGVPLGGCTRPDPQSWVSRAGHSNVAEIFEAARVNKPGEQATTRTLGSWLLKHNGQAAGRPADVVTVDSEASSEGECRAPCKKSGASASTTGPGSSSSDEGTGSSESAGGESGTGLPFFSPHCENMTTLVLRRLPARCSQNRLLKFFPPDGSYDFLFAPYSAEQRRPCRYCFINFTSPSAARVFVNRWHGKYLVQPCKGEPLDAQLAEVQGLRANVEKHRHLASAEKEHHPAVFRGKRRIRFQELVASFAAEPLVAQLN